MALPCAQRSEAPVCDPFAFPSFNKMPEKQCGLKSTHKQKDLFPLPSLYTYSNIFDNDEVYFLNRL